MRAAGINAVPICVQDEWMADGVHSAWIAADLGLAVMNVTDDRAASGKRGDPAI
jgi:hypothetical protein